MTLNLTFLQGLIARLLVNGRQRHRATDLPAESPLAVLEQSCEALMRRAGEAAELRLAHQALCAYLQLDAAGRLAFFDLLTRQYGACFDTIHGAYDGFRTAPDQSSAQALFAACEPRRQELLRRLNRRPGATIELVRMRSQLLELLAGHPSLRPLDSDFVHLFSSWFNRGFLVLERIDWDTSASILERVIRYEAVHEIRTWEELRRRLDPTDRRCYAFFHPATGDEPLIFVEVALCRGTPSNIRQILEADDSSDHRADTAVFYSISNCQSGLKGISFGNFLIKQVAQELSHEAPGLRTFVTLSPMPTFASWVQSELGPGAALPPPDTQHPLANDEGSRALDEQLVALTARYLLTAKDRNDRPLDPVARFHLGNGASLAGIHARADLSPAGVEQSLGVMVNYRYELDAIERNHDAYTRDGTVVATPAIERAARRAIVPAAQH